MKRVVLALAAVIVATPLFAGLTYDFKSVTTGRGGAEMAGTAMVEGTSMRMEFTKGDKMVIKDNSVVISRDGGKTLIVLDTAKKTYFELKLEELMSSMGNIMKSMGGVMKMSIDNQKADVTEAGKSEDIEGFPTRKYVVTSSYDMNMKVMGMNMNTSIETKTESWTTDKLQREYMTFVQQKGFKTGMEDMDKLIAAQSAGMKGFPLKQIMTTKSTSRGKTETSVTTNTVSNVKTVGVAASKFEIPAGYKEADSPIPDLDSMQ